MIYRRALILMLGATLFAFGLRVVSLDTQSMWRDEIDTICFAYDFWALIEQAARQGINPNQYDLSSQETIPNDTSAGSNETTAQPPPSAVSRPRCQLTPGLDRVDPANGLWTTLRALLTLPGWNGPFYTVAMRPWIVLTGESPFALRYLSSLFGVLAVPLTYVLGRRLLGTGVGLVGAGLVALSPHLVWYSQEAKMYGVILALGLLAIYALRRALDSDRSGAPWWIGLVGATTLAFYSHILAVLLVPLHVALGLIWWPQTRRHWRGALIALAFLTLPYLPLLAWQARNWLLPAEQATLFVVGRLDVMLEATFSGWGGNFVAAPWATLILVGLALLALFAVAWVWLMDEEAGGKTTETDRKSRADHAWRAVSALLVWMMLPLLGIWLLSARQPIFTNRYLVWAAPAFYLLAATGFILLSRLGRGGALVASGLMLAVLLGDGRALLYQSTQPIKPDFKTAAQYLQERYQPGDLIVFHLSYMEHNFDYYYSGTFDGWGAPAPASGWSEADIDSYMRSSTSGRNTVWLVLSEAEMWDPHGLIKAWMDAHAVTPPEESTFAHVSVYKYHLDDG